MKDQVGSCAQFTREQVSGNIYIRPCLLSKKGDSVQGHEHNFDHTTIFFSGSFHVKTYDPGTDTRQEMDFTAPDFMLIKKHVHHEIISTSEGESIFWCVYSHRDPNGEVVQEFNHRQESYG
jgi:hypothetical protein